MKTQIRTKVTAAVVCALLISSAGIPLPAAASSFEAHYTTASLSAQEHRAGNLLNSDRLRYSLAPLIIDPELSRIARIKSEDMRDNQYFAHTSPTYGDVRNMLRHFGYAFSSASENIARHATIEKAQAAFLSSPGHRKNVLHTGFARVGVGVALDQNGYVYLTQIFAR
ncbi:MAG: hypothetical protein IJD60_05420 [Clostridia bacterium]|nr:hypothetical protein [Clostridia bacterium]